MTAILVAVTIALFLGLDYWRTRARRQSAPRPIAIPTLSFSIPDGLFAGPGHTWASVQPDGTIRVGIDEFASRLLGRVDRIEVAGSGSELQHDDAAMVVHQDGKSVAFAAPIEGTVTGVNTEVLRQPSRLRTHPYDGWLLCVKPRRLASGLRRLRIGEEAREWARSEIARLGEFLAAQTPCEAVGTTLPDGGVLVANVLETLDAETWVRFEQEFLAVR